MGNKVFKVPIELHDGTVLPDDLGSVGGGASVHAGPEAPTDPPDAERPDGSLWIDTDEVTGDLMGVPATYAKMQRGSTLLNSGAGAPMTGFTEVFGEAAWCDAGAGTITIPEDGWYTVGFGFRSGTGGPSGTRWLGSVVKEVGGVPDTVMGTRVEITSGGGSHDPSLSGSAVDYLAAGTVIRTSIYQDSGVDQTSDFQAIWVMKIADAPVVLDNRYALKSEAAVKPEVLASGDVGTLQNGWEDYNTTSVTHTLHFWKVGRAAYAQGLFRNLNVPGGTSVMIALNPEWLPYASRQIVHLVQSSTNNPVELRVTSNGIELWTGHGLTGSVWVSVGGLQWLTASEEL